VLYRGSFVIGAGLPPSNEDWVKQSTSVGHAPFWEFVDWWLLPLSPGAGPKESDIWLKCKFCDFFKRCGKGAPPQHGKFAKHLTGMVSSNNNAHGHSARLREVCLSVAASSIVPLGYVRYCEPKRVRNFDAGSCHDVWVCWVRGGVRCRFLQ
jgi:hypothetical protein